MSRLKTAFEHLEYVMSRNIVMYALMSIMCVFLGIVSVVALTFYTRAQPAITVVEINVLDREVRAGGEVHLEMHTQARRVPYVGILIVNWREADTNIHVIPNNNFGRIITEAEDRTVFNLPVPCRVTPGTWVMELATLDTEVVVTTPPIEVTEIDPACSGGIR